MASNHGARGITPATRLSARTPISMQSFCAPSERTVWCDEFPLSRCLRARRAGRRDRGALFAAPPAESAGGLHAAFLAPDPRARASPKISGTPARSVFALSAAPDFPARPPGLGATGSGLAARASFDGYR